MDEPAPAGEDSADPDGIEGGKKGGIAGGLPDGDPGGVLDGIPGGNKDGLPGGEGIGPIEQDAPLYLTGEVRPPERTTFVKPEYPEMARKVRAEGRVILEIVVGRDGDVETVKVIRSSPLFDRAAVEAVSRWKYQPALQSGRPVRVYLTVIVDFGLK